MPSKKKYTLEESRDRAKARGAEYYQRNKKLELLRSKLRVMINKDRHQQQCRDWHIKNKEKSIKQREEWKQDNPERVLEAERIRSKRPDVRERKAAYIRRKRATDISFKLASNLRRRLSEVVKRSLRGSRGGSAISDLGCTVEELIIYLEGKFLEGMNWDNWNRTGWHIDHIIPLASFDLSDPEQCKRAVHYTNLQPLWAVDNLSKGAKLLSGS